MYKRQEKQFGFIIDYEGLLGELDNAWTEAPLAIQQGGAVTGLTGNLHVYPWPGSGRFIVASGAQARRLLLAPSIRGDERPSADQLLVWTGVDMVLRHDPARMLRGQILDDTLVRPTGLSDSVILSLRHYELFGDADPLFLSRVSLVDRSSIDNASLVLRDAFAQGRFGIDMRAGAGYDRLRSRILSQAGASFQWAPTAKSRVSLSYDVAHETTTGLGGTRQTGWLTYHADI